MASRKDLARRMIGLEARIELSAVRAERDALRAEVEKLRGGAAGKAEPPPAKTVASVFDDLEGVRSGKVGVAHA